MCLAIPGKVIEIYEEAGKIATGAVGITVASSAGISLPSRAYAKNRKIPWGYKKLDPVRVGKIAYEGYYKDYCCYGVAKGILLPLQEDIGEPFTLFPLESTIWGQGGGVGWGTLCGALNGAGTATAIVAGKEGQNILNDLIAWYTRTELPIYKPSNPRTKIRRKSISDSALCHVSVGKWMEEEGWILTKGSWKAWIKPAPVGQAKQGDRWYGRSRVTNS